MDFFSGRKLVIATRHRKETVIAPRVTATLGVTPFVPPDFDTDQFGTFSGEVPRTLDPLATARKKCEAAMEITGTDLAISSEGSFGPHPTYLFIPGNEEIVMLLDRKHGFEIVGRSLSTMTNFDGQLCTSKQELLAFAERVDFPAHAIILREQRDSYQQCFKGINHAYDLARNFQTLVDLYGQAYAETDMRAMFNPMRMKVIGEATEDMLKKATRACERCGSPGFGITDVKRGLACLQCGRPTRSAKAYMHTCVMCAYSKEEPNLEKAHEEPMYCDYCNP